ncbi:MAG: hypothetical protein IT453_18915, partial [Planctomycetes bacterium]|nr:hypothetical protein [Planctomycetota bacterium]
MLAVQEPWWILYIVLMLGFAAGAIVWTSRVEARTIETWRRFASDRGLRFVLDPSPWYRGKSFHVEGEVRGISFRIEKWVVRRGKNSQVYTLLSAHGPELVERELSVLPNHFGTRLAKLFAKDARPTGDEAFDARFRVYPQGFDEPREVLHEAARAKLLELDRLDELVLRSGTATLRWLRLERSPEKLQRAIEAAVTLYAR